MLLAALVSGPAAGAESFGPDPSPDAGTLAPDPAPQATPAPTRTLSQPARGVGAAVTASPVVRTQPAPPPAAPRTEPNEAVAAPPKREPRRAEKPRPAAEPAYPTMVAVTARIDGPIRRTLQEVAQGTSPSLLAALALFALVLASSSFLWLLRLRGEDIR